MSNQDPWNASGIDPLHKLELARNEITRLCAALAEAAKYGFVQGYNAGYDDTVEGWYGYQEEKADEWYEDAEADGSLKEIIDAAMAREEG